MLLRFIASVLSSLAGTLTLSGENIDNAETPVGELYGGVRVGADGKVYSILGDSGAGGPDFVAIDTGTDWIIPNAAASGAYKIRAVIVSGDAIDVSAAAVATWHTLTADRDFYHLESSPNDQDTQLRLELSVDESNVLESGIYNISVSF